MDERQGKYKETGLIPVILRVGHLGGHLILIPQMCSTDSLDASVLSNMLPLQSQVISDDNKNNMFK